MSFTKEEVVGMRRQLFSEHEKSIVFNKGDKRVHSPRLCSICGRLLSSFIAGENRYIINFKHTRFHLGNQITVDICTDIHSCYRVLSKKGELIENVDGR